MCRHNRDLAVLAGHRGDVQPFRIYLAVLAPVPDFTLPAIILTQASPHAFEEFCILAVDLSIDGLLPIASSAL